MQIGIGCRIHDDRPILLKRIASRIAMHACAMELIMLMLLLFQQHCALRKGMSSNIDIIFVFRFFCSEYIYIHMYKMLLVVFSSPGKHSNVCCWVKHCHGTY